MRCHYVVLGITNNATDEELKKSHRRLALQWHPDKNPDNLEEATEKFQELQNAYEVLSDPQERAFYDRNRESILFGDNSEEKGEIIKIFDFFNTSCFTGYDDSEKGFYTVYRRVFETIIAKDLEYVDDPTEVSIPHFGRSDSDLEDVGEFYGYWQSYCTFVSFCWVFEYDIRLATKRWIEKKVEKENKKLRDKAKRKYNEEVRSLVAFVRKRDKRWTSLKKKLEEKVVENARKQEEYQQQQKEKRRKWLEETTETQKESMAEYENQLKAMEAQYAAEWGLSEDEEEEYDEDDENGEGEELEEFAGANKCKDLYCIACEKIFKTDKAFLNHEQSKKHQENISTLKQYMQEEETFFTTQTTNQSSNLVTEKSSTSKKKKKKRNQLKRQEAKKAQDHPTCGGEESLLNGGIDEPLGESLSSTDTNNIKCECPPGEQLSPVIEEKLDGELEPTKCQDGSRVGQDRASSKPKLKPKQSKDKKKQNDKSSTQKSTSEPVCSTCGSVFPSKNKLFSHIKDSGHAAMRDFSKQTKKSKR